MTQRWGLGGERWGKVGLPGGGQFKKKKKLDKELKITG